MTAADRRETTVLAAAEEYAERRIAGAEGPAPGSRL